MARLFAAAVAVVICVGMFGASAASAATSTGWKIQTTTNPGTNNALSAVSCTSTTRCTAVGSYTNHSSVSSTLAERWNGTTWATQTTLNPSGYARASLNGVSCASASMCIAVGSYISSVGQTLTMAERWNGTTWALQSVPNPLATRNDQFYGVSCPSATTCTAVGFWTDGSQNEFALAEFWNGTSWTIQSTPTVTGKAVLGGVSCPSTTACNAVGSTLDSSNVSSPLAERWGKTTGWAAQTTPAPPGSSGLNAVSCTPSTTVCTAVGFVRNSSSVSATLAERWNGTTWTIQTTPVFTNDASLSGVSCPSTTSCTASGNHFKGSNGTNTLAEHWNGTNWSVQTTPNRTVTNVLNGVSCPSTTACTAVGYSGGTLAERR